MTDDPRCPAHPDAPAIAACVQCGRWVCAACRRVGDDGLGRCTECLPADEAALEDGLPETPENREVISDVPADAEPSGEIPPAVHAPTAQATPERPAASRAPTAEAPDEPPRPNADVPSIQVVLPSPVAWERGGRLGDLQAFVLTARQALLGPAQYMGRIPWMRRDLRTPLLFAVLAGVVGHLGLMLLTGLTGPPIGMGGATGLTDMTLGGSLALAPLLPLMITVSIFVGSWLAHLMLRLAGDPPRPYEATFRIYAYAEVSSLLLLVPWIGLYAAQFAFIFLLLTGFRMAQGAGFSASLLAMAPSVVLTWLV